jgi:hypothetical protein
VKAAGISEYLKDKIGEPVTNSKNRKLETSIEE